MTTKDGAHASIHIALLRGINVSGRNMIAMPALRTLCEELGWGDLATYIQSGNLIFCAAARRCATATTELEAELERAIERRFRLSIPVIVRSAAVWSAYGTSNPFSAESEREPNRVMLALSKGPLKAGAADALRERAMAGERLVEVGDAIWIHYPAGAGQSKLSTALFDRVCGSPVTARNWRTVVKLDELTRKVAR